MGKRTWATLACVAAVVALPLAAGCGDDDDDEATTEQVAADDADALQEEIADLSDEEQIERVGAAWAEPFAAGDEEMCSYLHPDIAPTRETCVAAAYHEGSLTGGLEQQSSFAGTEVTDVSVQGDTATATFSNREQVEFRKDPEGAWKISSVRR